MAGDAGAAAFDAAAYDQKIAELVRKKKQTFVVCWRRPAAAAESRRRLQNFFEQPSRLYLPFSPSTDPTSLRLTLCSVR